MKSAKSTPPKSGYKLNKLPRPHCVLLRPCLVKKVVGWHILHVTPMQPKSDP